MLNTVEQSAGPHLLDLRRQRVEIKKVLASDHEEVFGLAVEILQRVIEQTMPEARQLVFGAQPCRQHWSGTMLELQRVIDAKGDEIAWLLLLDPDDLQLLRDLQTDLTESFAIPQDKVSLAITFGSDDYSCF